MDGKRKGEDVTDARADRRGADAWGVELHDLFCAENGWWRWRNASLLKKVKVGKRESAEGGAMPIRRNTESGLAGERSPVSKIIRVNYYYSRTLSYARQL